MWITLSRGGLRGIPIGNLTSQLFANVYMNQLDHFIKEQLQARWYVRYTDDFVILDTNPVRLVSSVSSIRQFSRDKLRIEVHPRKIVLKKLRQGIDFLGYVLLPRYRVLRTKTKQRMFKKMTIRDGKIRSRMESYFGMLKFCKGYRLRRRLLRIVLLK